MPYPSRPCKVIDRLGLRQKAVSTNQIQVVNVSTGEIEGDVAKGARTPSDLRNNPFGTICIPRLIPYILLLPLVVKSQFVNRHLGILCKQVKQLLLKNVIGIHHVA